MPAGGQTGEGQEAGEVAEAGTMAGQHRAAQGRHGRLADAPGVRRQHRSRSRSRHRGMVAVAGPLRAPVMEPAPTQELFPPFLATYGKSAVLQAGRTFCGCARQQDGQQQAPVSESCAARQARPSASQLLGRALKLP